MATNEVRPEKEGDFTDFTSAGEETLGFDDNTLRAIAEVYKNEGNDAFKREEFSSAAAFYSEGIKVNCRDEELNAKLYHNRSMAHFYSGNYQESLDDAKAATELQPTYIKAIARGASACVKLLLYKDAITWCDKGLAIDKKNKALLQLRAESVDGLEQNGLNDLNKSQTQTVKGEISESSLCQMPIADHLTESLRVSVSLLVLFQPIFERNDSQVHDARTKTDLSRNAEHYFTHAKKTTKMS